MTLPYSNRAANAVANLGINRINTYWKRVSLPALALELIRQSGLAKQTLLTATNRLGVSLDEVSQRLLNLAAINREFLVAFRRILSKAEELSVKCGGNYIGTEHLLLAAIESNCKLLDFGDVKVDFPAYSSALSEHLGSEYPCDPQKYEWPEWAPRDFLCVEDFPPSMAEDARVIVETFAILSHKELVSMPCIQAALGEAPKSIDELRKYVVSHLSR